MAYRYQEQLVTELIQALREFEQGLGEARGQTA